jgi:lipopolysaccharide/colanic/teichoic acid biosynthesis glycosyltransferase
MSLSTRAVSARMPVHPVTEDSIVVAYPLAPHPLRAATESACALLFLILAIPVLLVAFALIKLTSRGPFLYRQTRLGKNGRPYALYKLRTMVNDSEKDGACWSLPGDPRVTPVGRFLRRTHLDELPQLWNVLRGDMSLIGPRPERPEFVAKLELCIAHYRSRLLVRPGVTGLAQVQLPADSDLDSVRIKLAYDIWYMRHQSFGLNLRIIIATVLKLVGCRFSLLRALLRFPLREAVEKAYLELPTIESSESDLGAVSAPDPETGETSGSDFFIPTSEPYTGETSGADFCVPTPKLENGEASGADFCVPALHLNTSDRALDKQRASV